MTIIVWTLDISCGCGLATLSQPAKGDAVKTEKNRNLCCSLYRPPVTHILLYRITESASVCSHTHTGCAWVTYFASPLSYSYPLTDFSTKVLKIDHLSYRVILDYKNNITGLFSFLFCRGRFPKMTNRQIFIYFQSDKSDRVDDMLWHPLLDCW